MLLSILLMFKFFFFAPAPKADVPKSIYDFKVESLSGGTIDLAQYKGKKILIVNTASKCGYTPQYKDLEALYEKYKDKMVIIGFPSNNFLWQEPGSNKEISEFCQKNYGVTFPMAAKIAVKGKDMAPIYQWLTSKEYNGYKNSSVKWNFQKYLIDEKGNLVDVFDPGTKPMDAAVISAIEK
ncbi:glutathione peroxidase [Chitinophagaceae bacterium MMS25-I14]